MKVGVIGGGAWGSALACVAARAGHETALWCRSAAQATEITEHHTNSAYLEELLLDPRVSASDDLAATLQGSNLLLLAVPAQSLRSVLESLSPVDEKTTLVTTCKGIDRETAKLPSDMVASAFGTHAIATLSGPSFATDVVRGLPTAVTVASRSIDVAEQVSSIMSTSEFRCYANDDIIGVELGGSLKNVLALAVGAARGMRLGASAEAALIARGFAEISRLATKFGAKPSTLMGLSGLGDIVLTCSTPQSRNFAYGAALGEGKDLAGMKLAEGAFTASVALQLAKEQGVEVPITSAIVDVLEKRLTAREAVEKLLTRPLRRES